MTEDSGNRAPYTTEQIVQDAQRYLSLLNEAEQRDQDLDQMLHAQTRMGTKAGMQLQLPRGNEPLKQKQQIVNKQQPLQDENVQTGNHQKEFKSPRPAQTNNHSRYFPAAPGSGSHQGAFSAQKSGNSSGGLGKGFATALFITPPKVNTARGDGGYVQQSPTQGLEGARAAWQQDDKSDEGEAQMFENILAQIFKTSDNKNSQQKAQERVLNQNLTQETKDLPSVIEEQIFADRKLSGSRLGQIFGCGLVPTEIDAPQVSNLDEDYSIFGEQQTRPNEQLANLRIERTFSLMGSAGKSSSHSCDEAREKERLHTVEQEAIIDDQLFENGVKSPDLMTSLSNILKKKAKKSECTSPEVPTTTPFNPIVISNYNITSPTNISDDLASGLSCQSVEFRAQSAKQPLSPAQAEENSPSKAAQENKQQNQPQPVHKGSVRWAKYKNRPQPAMNVVAPKKENVRENNKRRPLKNAAQPAAGTFSTQSTSSSDPKKAAGTDQLGFQFPDNGWVCKQCQNYNFPGRTCCHRCKKVKQSDDQEGKPRHLLIPRFHQPRGKNAPYKKGDKDQQQSDSGSTAGEKPEKEEFCSPESPDLQTPSQVKIDGPTFVPSFAPQNPSSFQSASPATVPHLGDENSSDQPAAFLCSSESNKENKQAANFKKLAQSVPGASQFATEFQQMRESNNNQSRKASTTAGAKGNAGPKVQSVRVGDWVCLNCANENYGFRKNCNLCDLSRATYGKTIETKEELEQVTQQKSSGILNNSTVFNIAFMEQPPAQSQDFTFVGASSFNRQAPLFMPTQNEATHSPGPARF